MKFKMLVAGSCCLGFPVAAQTVLLPSTQSSTAVAREQAIKDAMRESNAANKTKDVNSLGGSNGYDIVAFDTRRSAIRGTPFLVPNWAMGEVMIESDPKPKPGILKFDAYTQQVWALRPQGDSIILSSEQIKEFSIRPTGSDGKPVERRFYRLPPALISDMSAAFAEQLSVGEKVQLLKFQRKTILKATNSGSYSSGSLSDAYENATVYFLRLDDGKCVPVKPTKASILAAISQRYAQAAAAEMQDRTKLRSDAELGALVQRIDKVVSTK